MHELRDRAQKIYTISRSHTLCSIVTLWFATSKENLITQSKSYYVRGSLEAFSTIVGEPIRSNRELF